MGATAANELTGVELRQKNLSTGDVDRLRRDGHGDGSGGGDDGDWNSRPASRLGALRRPATSTCLPHLLSARRHAVLVVDDDDRRPASDGETDPEQ